MNNVTLIGNLGQDPVLRHTPSGNPVLNFNLAVDRRYYTTINGERRLHSSVDWIPVVVWNRQAETCATYLQKGSKIAVMGTLRQRQNTAMDGTVTNVLEVKGEKISFLANIKAKEEQT